eukprot:g46215.t1
MQTTTRREASGQGNLSLQSGQTKKRDSDCVAAPQSQQVRLLQEQRPAYEEKQRRATRRCLVRVLLAGASSQFTGLDRFVSWSSAKLCSILISSCCVVDDPHLHRLEWLGLMKVDLW